MKYTYFLYLFAAALLLTGTSCKKYINEAPITSTYDAKFWSSQTSAEQAVYALYGQFRSCLRADASHFVFGDLASGMFVPASSQWNYTTITVDQQFDFSYVPYLEGSLKNWSRFYKVIAQANLIIERVPAMADNIFTSAAAKNAFVGEALFMKALTYFYITRAWGDPVYVDKTYNDVDYGNIPPIARTAETIVLDSCISDLKKASAYLDYSGGDPTKTLRANKGSVYALLAHIYAWKHDYANAHTACQEVINNGGYSLEPADSYQNIWKGQSSAENIFEIAMKFNSNDNNFLNSADGYNNYNDWTEGQFNFFATFLKDDYVDGIKNNCWLAPVDNIDPVFSTDDIRFNKILKHVDASGGDKEGYMLLKYTNFNYQNTSLSANAYIDNNLSFFRLADILLLDAEALAMQDNTAAVTPLNQVLNRAGLENYSGPTDKTSLVKTILQERGKELIGEGQWAYDMIRTEAVANSLTETLGYQQDRVNQKGYYWPIDMSALFKTDPLLTQNPWWASH